MSSTLDIGEMVHLVEGSQASLACPPGMRDVKMKMSVEHVEIILMSLIRFILGLKPAGSHRNGP